MTSSSFLVDVLLRCYPYARDCSASQTGPCLPSIRAERCSQQGKSVSLWINGVHAGTNTTHKVVTFGAMGVPQGENELTVQADMESFPKESLSMFFQVDALAPAHGHDVSLTAYGQVLQVL